MSGWNLGHLLTAPHPSSSQNSGSKSVPEFLPCEEGDGTALQYSCLENPMDGGAWWAVVYGVAKSRTRLSDFTFIFHFQSLEKEMATTPVFLPGESQGRRSLPAMGSHRVGRD